MPPTVRERVRAEFTAEITAAARRQLAEVGAAGLSLRAVARELGVASSALYRYFAGRDELLTRLIVDGYDGLGSAAEAADDPAAPAYERWMAVCRAVRAWARAHPHEYALLYGSPVPGYRAPRDTVPAASRVGLVMGRVLGDAARVGLLPEPAGVPRDPTLVSDDAVRVLGGEHPALDDTVRVRALLAWSSLYGTISFELFGHFVGTVEDADRFAEAAMGELAGLLGLRSQPPTG
ncbi:TetR/AcrR family transcriptional regulator [Geodermatophilus marinus]|uniref:TetR/AcrR family transcriptional regulator n=1 Tax=Geodermatophilus sp. LHW52908 TaxID=2303986 RepID=UPI000E3BA90C|nr:TetR/AcrR family transcriptional regulator [Geodermatophilus sp. LHW52908]RFU23254.1 TetR/AcrR family transcriptional regulator [Geodermatophilus sp. LHW52908]